MDRSSPDSRFRFDQFEVDLSAAELRRNGRRVPIQDKPLRLLVFLSQRPGEVISRSEIQEHLWPPDTTVVFEDGVNTAVRKLREALNDNSEKPRYVETVRLRGYRFLGKIRTVPPDLPPAPAPETPPAPASVTIDEPEAVPSPPALPIAPPRTRPTMRWVSAIVGGLAIAATITAAVVRHYRVAAALADSARPHAIAVLPIANLSGDPKLSYLSDGATEEIIARLGDEDPESVRVIARTSAMAFRDSKLTIGEIGQALGVDYLLEGTFQGDRSHLHLIIRLVRASDQSQLWTRSYIGTPAELQEFENDIADRAARSLPGTRKPGSEPQQTIVTAEAHDLYLRGLYALGQRSKAGFETALVDFGDAVQHEPRYPEAYAELAVAYNLMGQYGWMRQDEARSQGKAAALQALALDPTLAEARAALGFSYWYYDWDSPRGRDELTSAVARQPNNVDAHHWLAMVLITTGQLPAAEQQMREAIKLDPASPILKTNLGWVHYTEGRFPLAVQEMQAVTRQNPQFLSAHYKLIPAAYLMGDRRLAWSETQTFLRLSGATKLVDEITQVYQKDGYNAGMKALLASPVDTASYANPVELAKKYLSVDDTPDAIRELQAGLDARNGWMIFIRTDPAFAPLAHDPAFTRILAAVKPPPSPNPVTATK